MIRTVSDSDKDHFIELSLKLARYNREHHPESCKQDNFNAVLEAIKRKAEKTFRKRNEEIIVLIAELENKPVGYALGKIYQQEETADNGTGRMGLFDELYVDESARGNGLGRQLTEEMLNRFKQKEINRVKLHAYSWNEAAQKIYHQFGFCQYAVAMEKYLEPEKK